MRKRSVAFFALNSLLLMGAMVSWLAGLSTLAWLAASAAVVLVLLWLTVYFFRGFLWRVGRKLAFSYFLIGVLPIPMVALLGCLAGYVLSGALVGHIFRDELLGFHRELHDQAEELFNEFSLGNQLSEPADLRTAFYWRGKRVTGSLQGAPGEWPDWLGEGEDGAGPVGRLPFVLADEGGPRLAVTLQKGEAAVLGVFVGDLEGELRRRGGIWVELESVEDMEDQRVSLVLPGDRTLVLRSGTERDAAAREAFFGGPSEELPWRDRPLLYWAEMLPRVQSLVDPEPLGRFGAVLNANPATVYRQVVSSNAQVDAAAWGALVMVAFLLFDLYALAVLMALYMIFGLSRAVNRMSRATAAVQQGDFSVRIPVKRQDQLGELQRSFNLMASSLEELVSAAARKESLEKELETARELQQNLLPDTLTSTETVEFASYFEPSAAIGGDYFDLIRLDEQRLAVVVADVSGHGLSAGLRMAMLKAALVMLVEQRMPEQEIFRRLDGMVRREQRVAAGRPLVTATLAIFTPRTGRLEMINAGHPPTYWLRGGDVEEIVLPSPPLGALGSDYARRVVRLSPGDVVVWLSDGLVEAVDDGDRAFGYERVVFCLDQAGGSAAEVRDRLWSAVAKHCGGRPPDDDRTLVVMRYLPVAVGRGDSEPEDVPTREPVTTSP